MNKLKHPVKKKSKLIKKGKASRLKNKAKVMKIKHLVKKG